MDNKGQKSNDITNVEFGIEFGDLNSAKLYEMAFSNQSTKQQENKQKRKK